MAVRILGTVFVLMAEEVGVMEAMVFICYVFIATGKEVCGTEPVPLKDAQSLYDQPNRIPGTYIYLKDAK